ncbi:hypothetical protein ACIHBQ_21995 [Streptomyces sp. NPDC052492]|uniref:hypothetical protein n=1 Tax=unclassified Streptomyces TaxID=2593676 RepID=UPI0037D174D6
MFVTRPTSVALELVVLPVSDVDFRLDVDKAPVEGWRAVHLTPPGSEAAIMFGEGLTTAEPG